MSDLIMQNLKTTEDFGGLAKGRRAKYRMVFDDSAKAVVKTSQKWINITPVSGQDRITDRVVSGVDRVQELPEGAELPELKVYLGLETTYIFKRAGGKITTTKYALENNEWKSQMDLVKKESKAATEYFERGAYSVLNAAFTTAAVVDGITQYRLADGKALLSSSHVMTNGDLGVNVLTDSAPISPASIDDLKVLLATTKGENGEIIGYDGPLVLVVPASLESQAKVIVGSMQLPGTNFNDINTNTGIEVVVGKYLTSSTAYFLVAKDSNQMNTFVRQEPSIEFDENAGRRTIETSIESWAAFGYSDWRGVAGSRGDSVPYAG